MSDDFSRSRQLIESLDLMPHPEGGFFGEVFRSDQHISTIGTTGEELGRSAMSSIYFLLTFPEFSCWHVVDWDELWHFYEGRPSELLTIDPSEMILRRRYLGPLDSAQEPVLVVPAGHWQAARPVDGYTLAGCTVGPGFEFSDMRLLRDNAAAADEIARTFPEVANLL